MRICHGGPQASAQVPMANNSNAARKNWKEQTPTPTTTLAKLGLTEHCHKVALLGKKAVHPKKPSAESWRAKLTPSRYKPTRYTSSPVCLDYWVSKVRLRRVSVGKRRPQWLKHVGVILT